MQMQTHMHKHTNLKGCGSEGVSRGDTKEQTADCFFFLGSHREIDDVQQNLIKTKNDAYI